MSLKTQISAELDETKKVQKQEADFEKAWAKITLKPAQLPTGRDLKDITPDDLANALALRSMAAELLDYKGQYSLASDFVEKPGEYCLAALKTILRTGSLPHGSRELMKQQIWVVLQAGLCKYRAASYDDALSMFNVCNSVLSREPDTWIGTRARCLYSIGLIHRERYELKQAIQTFTETTELAYKSLDRLTGGHSQLALVAIARAIGMGLASVHNTLGQPDIAIPLLLSAKAMLPKGERVISTHFDLIRATLIPWTYASSDEGSIIREEDRIKELDRCRSVFEKLAHHPYQARAAHRLAEARLRRCRVKPGKSLTPAEEKTFAKVEENIHEFESLAPGDSRFITYGLCLKSEIARLRGHFDRAEALASNGLSINRGEHLAVELDLRMARAEARIHKDDGERAILDLQKGLGIAKHANNHHQYSIFLLKLAEAHAKTGSEKEALRYINQFAEMEHFLEIKAPDIEALKKKISESIGAEAGSLVFSLKEELNRDEAEKKFYRFLVNWARYKKGTDTAAARELGISRTTLYTWEKA